MTDKFVHLHVHSEYCLHPNTRIATSDLQWIPIKNAVVGQSLIGFGEKLKGNQSRMMPTIVEGIKTTYQPCYLIVMENGSEIIASADHGWVCTGTKGSSLYPGGPSESRSNSRKWVKTKNLVPGETSIVLWAKPWEGVPDELKQKAGWLAGIADGEGWISSGQINFAQNPGPVLDEIFNVCQELGYDISREYKSKNSNCSTFWLSGYENALKFLSQCDPVRFRGRWEEVWTNRKAGSKITKPVLVKDVINIGYRETIALQTSTRTLIAEGFLSHNSILDGAAKVSDMTQKAAEDEMPGLGITDHGNLYGVIPHYKACKKVGVNPIIGTELYQALDHRSERIKRKTKRMDDFGGEDDAGRKSYYHLTALAENNEGYKNLIQLSSRSFLEGYYQKPRVDWDLLSQHSKGIIVTSGCLGGQVLQYIMHDDYEQAKARAGILQDIFGRDNFFIEIQNHGIEEQLWTNPILLKLAKEINAPVIATNDSHYTNHEDHEGHDTLLCQPPGTQILLIDGSSINIENIKPGDKVITWSSDQRRGRIIPSGSSITEIGNRNYNGNLITIKTPSGKTSSYTHDHICVARMDSELDEGNYVNYLMRLGDKYRIGSTQFQRARSKDRPIGGVLGPVARAKEQLADAVWVLGVFKTKHEAHEEEYFLSHQFNIPTWSFPEGRSPTTSPRTDYYASLWNRIDRSKLQKRAEELLLSHNRDIKYPFWDIKTTKPGQRRPSFVRACNLISGMLVCEPDARKTKDNRTYHGSNAWQPIVVNSVPYDGVVYSIEVGETHTYIADGIVTHNCIQTGSYISDPGRFKFHGDQHYLKSSQEMWELFNNEANCCSNTLWINERCNVEIELDGKLKLPKFAVPENYNDDNEYLRALVYGGAKKRYEKLSDEIVERIEFELNVIQSMNYASYFLMLWDIVRFARSMDIRTGPGRGSAAGAIIAYCLGITQIDPIKYDLLFERFLNPDRISPPDIDLDVDSRYRDVLINYAADKYGRDHVSQIITYSTIKARAALRDAARVLEFPYEVGDKLARAMPPLIAGRDTPLSACLELDPEYSEGYELAEPFREMYETDDEYRTVTDVALKLEGLRRQDGIHAAAVVISDAPITEYLPVQRKPDRDKSKALEELPIVTQYEMHAVEELGLLKMDFLGLRNLDVISDSLKLIKDIHGIDIDIDHIALDDEKTYELLRKGETVGIFQLESPPMRSLIRSLAPTTVHDLAALVALYRPGPMAANMHNEYADRKNNRKSVEFPHEDSEEILSETYGLMIYQEEMMKISQKFAGYTLAQSDSLRKACGKKDRELMKSERIKFIESCINNGYDKSVGEMWFDLIEPFADYSFNACLVGETQVLTKTGASSINDIALNLENGEQVILLSLDEGTVVEDECIEVIDSGELDVYEIEFDNGTKIEATLDHKFLCMDGVYYTLEDILKHDLDMIEIENTA